MQTGEACKRRHVKQAGVTVGPVVPAGAVQPVAVPQFGKDSLTC